MELVGLVGYYSGLDWIKFEFRWFSWLLQCFRMLCNGLECFSNEISWFNLLLQWFAMVFI